MVCKCVCVVCTHACAEGQGHVTFPSYLMWFFAEEPHDILSSKLMGEWGLGEGCACVCAHALVQRGHGHETFPIISPSYMYLYCFETPSPTEPEAHQFG